MLAKSAIKAATAVLLTFAVAQAADAQPSRGDGAENQAWQSATPNAHSGSAPSPSIPGVTPLASPVWAPTGMSGRVAPALSTPSSQPTLQQIRR